MIRKIGIIIYKNCCGKSQQSLTLIDAIKFAIKGLISNNNYLKNE